MRKPVVLILTNAFILIVVCGLFAQSLFIVQRVALTERVTGQVTLQRGGEGNFTLMPEGASVHSGDVVRTGTQSSTEFRWADGTRWKLAPNSLLVIKKALSNSLKRNELSRIDLEQGQVLVRLVKNLGPNSSFEVKTPNALVTGRGTIFSVSTQSGVTDVSVWKGRADIQEIGKNSQLSALMGQKARVSLLGVQISNAKSQNEFLASPTLLSPDLKINWEHLENGGLLLKGRTEAGNRVLIDGKSVPVLGNGMFLRHLSAGSNSANGSWKIQSTDRFGATSQIATPLPSTVPPSLVPAPYGQ